jgi:hypothetical protein
VAAAPETEADFERMSWHGCRIWKIEIVAGESDGQADLVFGLDLVVDALCGFNREAQFKLAPAALTFHAVTDLNIGVSCGDSGNRLLVQPLSIADITRAPTKHPTYHSWRVRLGWPPDGDIRFGAAGFDQVLLAEPIISATNVLTGVQRRQMLSHRSRVDVGK